jgi:hypothetical protein
MGGQLLPFRIHLSSSHTSAILRADNADAANLT